MSKRSAKEGHKTSSVLGAWRKGLSKRMKQDYAKRKTKIEPIDMGSAVQQSLFDDNADL
jgi:hypothetical protein